MSLSVFRLHFADGAEKRLEFSFSVEWKRTLTNNPKTKDSIWQAFKCPARGQHSTAVPLRRTLFGRHFLQRSHLVAPAEFRFTPNRRIHYLCVAQLLTLIVLSGVFSILSSGCERCDLWPSTTKWVGSPLGLFGARAENGCWGCQVSTDFEILAKCWKAVFLFRKYSIKKTVYSHEVV